MNRLIGVLMAAAVMSGCALAASPQDWAEAENLRLSGQVDARREAIQIRYEEARADALASTLAEMERDRLLKEQERIHEEEMSNLKLWYENERDKIEKDKERRQLEYERQAIEARAWAAAVVALSIGASLLLVQAGGGLGYLIRAWGRNRGESVYPHNGEWPAIVRPEGIYLPGRVPGSYQLMGRPGLIERLAMAKAYLEASRRGERTAPPSAAPWVLVPDFSEAQLGVTSRDQSINMLKAAVSGDGNRSVSDAARAGAARQAARLFGGGAAERVVPTPRVVRISADELLAIQEVVRGE